MLRESVTASAACVKLRATPMSDRKRPYRKTRRAELEEETRLRITESAVALHGSLGPARTSMSAIAEHAGVPRSTLYRHFPDDAAMFAACSAHWAAQNPPPDPSDWPAIADPGERTNLWKPGIETSSVAFRALIGYLRPPRAPKATFSPLTPEGLEELRALGYVR